MIKNRYDYFPHYTVTILKLIQIYFWFPFNACYLLFWGIRVHGFFRSIGSFTIRKVPGSEINIGPRTTFLSTSDSNLIGNNRRCIFSTNLAKSKIVIGSDCGFSSTVIGAFDQIIIGNGVRCGANTLITDSDWHLDDIRTGDPARIIIEDNVWLGANSTVLKGVRIGRNTVVGANSVVTKDLPENVIAAGNPCKVIKPLDSSLVLDIGELYAS